MDEVVVAVWRCAVRAAVVLGVLAVTGGAAVPAGAAAARFSTELSGLPARFTGGDEVRTVAAVVSSGGGSCVKVRWSMLLQVRGIRLDQVRMDRIEETGSFPVQIRTDGNTARLTDRRLDPGTLCPDRTVTARYRLAFAGDVSRGRITLAAEAYDANARLLARQTATRNVVGVGAAEATPPAAEPNPTGATPTAEPDPVEDVPAGEPATDPTEVALDEVPPQAGPGRPVAGAGGFGLVQAAFLLGGLLLFLGVGLLLRLRHLMRPARR